MKNIKKFIALGLAGAMALSLAACGSSNSGSGDAANYKKRTINIGSWWREYYATGDKQEDSADWVTAQFSDDDDEAKRAEKTVNQKIAQLKWDNVPTLEKDYNCEFYWQNLTYQGTKESMNTSILAGSPDCDIYMVDTGMAIPAQSNGLLLDLKTILPEDHDLFTEQKVMSYLDLGDGKACILKINGGMTNTYPLGFNVQMLEKNNLEDPRELYAKGEWTWDKFYEYCQVLTQDTDGDGQNDQFGFAGFVKDTLNQLLMANGTAIAGGDKETLSSPATGETLEFLAKLYATNGVSYPYEYSSDGNAPWDSMRIKYNEGNVGFFPIAVWIQNANGNYPEGGQGNLTWDTAYVQWPVGPSGDQATNPGVNAIDGNFFVIPSCVKEPERIFNFLYDLYNWYDGDTTLRDDPAAQNWWYNEPAKVEELRASNWAVQKYCIGHPGLEFYDSLGIEEGETFNLELLISGEQTPAQFQEMNKQVVQDALDGMFK